MKRTSLTLMTVGLLTGSLVLFSATGCETTQRADRDHASMNDASGAIEGSSVTMVVHGMGCPLCANNVDRQLKALPGVSDASIDLGSGEVKVQLADENRPTRSQLARAIQDSGFTLIRIETP
ncbi:MAG: copper chaperone [Phycisphaerales bacterium]|nr:MAG: copper chaperone [Phycisphaerales bacterium]